MILEAVQTVKLNREGCKHFERGNDLTLFTCYAFDTIIQWKFSFLLRVVNINVECYHFELENC
jgi:hypothetical protein